MAEKSPTKFAIEGAKEIAEILNKLPLQVQASVLKSVNREGAKIVLDEMKKSAPVGDDRIFKSIKIRSDKENVTGVTVGPGKKAFWARFIEYGTAKRSNDAGANRGSISPKPFIRPSIDRTIDKVIKHVAGNYAELVDKYLSKQVKRINKKNAK